MKKVILFILIFVCNYSSGQTKELQQTIDSFKTALNEQNFRIIQLEDQVHSLYKVLFSVKKVLNDSMVFKSGRYTSSLIETHLCKAVIDGKPCGRKARKGSDYCSLHQSMKSRLKTSADISKSPNTYNDVVNSKRAALSFVNESINQKGPRGGKYLRTINGKKYYKMSNGKIYFVMPNRRIVWVNR